MAKSEWGTKRSCRSCGEPFYDLKKKNIECPKCGTPFNSNPPARPKRPAPVAKAIEQDVGSVGEKETPAPASSVPKPVAGAPTDSDANDPVLEGDDLNEDGDSKDDEKDDALIEDTSDLGRDDDDVSEVKEHIDDGVEDKN